MDHQRLLIFPELFSQNQTVVVHPVVGLQKLKYCVFIQVHKLAIDELEELFLRVRDPYGKIGVVLLLGYSLVIFESV